MWGSHVFLHLYGFNFSGSNHETLRLLTIHPLRLASGGGSLRVLLQCSSATSWRMRGLVVRDRRVEEVREGSSREDRGSGKWMGRREHMLRSLSIQNICSENEQRIAWIKNNLGLQEHFVNLMANCTVCRTLGGSVPFITDCTLAVYGTICPWSFYHRWLNTTSCQNSVKSLS